MVYSCGQHRQYHGSKMCDTVVSVHPAAALWVAFVSDAVSGRPRHGSLGLQGFYHLVTECDGW